MPSTNFYTRYRDQPLCGATAPLRRARPWSDEFRAWMESLPAHERSKPQFLLPIFLRDWLDSLSDAEFDQFFASIVDLWASNRTASAPPDAPPFLEQWLGTRTVAERAIVAQTITRMLRVCEEDADGEDEDELDDEGDEE